MSKRLCGLIVGTVAFAGLGGAAGAQETLGIVSWGGAQQQAESRAWYQPFASAAGVSFVEDSWNGELGRVRGMVEAGDITWDVINGDYEHAVAGCEEGILERLDVEKLGGADQFLPGTVHECGIPTHIFSVIFGYNEDRIPEAWGDERPATIADMFDLERFPGARAIRSDPKWVLEPALMADGVPPEEVYDVLSTPEGVERALAKLDTIRDQVIWWTAGAQPPQLLADGEVAIAQAYAARLYQANTTEGKNFALVWHGQVYSANSWIVPKGAKLDLAMQFLEYLIQPEAATQMAKEGSSYGYAMKGADQYIPAELKSYLPTAPENLEYALASGETFWADNYEEISERFQRWLAQ